MDHVGWRYEPQGLTSAQLNLPYCVATLLLDGDVFVEQFTEAKVDDAERIRVSRKVSVAEDPAITARGKAYRHMVRVEVTLTDGTVLTETVEAPRGSEHSFATADDVVAKFRKLASARLPMAQVECIVDAVMGAELLPDVSALVGLLARSNAA
jgi:2-methylcitrate dehydratase PrpD